ncbi:hypothetical protein [uncultured Helicobacter sp.]|uniref:hypothetical protein n=1 Tax=uncultured Helicobacter sp. TaxID=175537 RepID=UPI00374E2AB0
MENKRKVAIFKELKPKRIPDGIVIREIPFEPKLKAYGKKPFVLTQDTKAILEPDKSPKPDTSH